MNALSNNCFTSSTVSEDSDESFKYSVSDRTVFEPLSRMAAG